MNQIKLLRARLGISQRELAKRTGVTQSSISKLENGERKIQARTLHKLADGLGCSIEDLANGNQERGV